MTNPSKSIELLTQKLDKAQVIERLKQINLKGGGNGNGCPPPSL